jgi:2-dehydro-3-deoxygalactonokinase
VIAIDWGTSSFRAYLLSPDGAVLEKREAPRGVLQMDSGTFADALQSEIGAWLAADPAPVMMCGMVGSRHGWLEVPYISCPAGVAEIAAGMREVRWDSRSAWIAPGVSALDEAAVPDVMRGEETQILGALDDLPAEARVCMPGTHSKWVRELEGRIVGFTTHMTGEVFAVLKDHSILGRTMADAPTDLATFSAGVARARQAPELLHHMFGVRTRSLTGDLPPASAASYLSGILIGHELTSAAADRGRVFLLGAQPLVDLYRRALRQFDCDAVVLDPDSAARGLFVLDRHLRKT